MSTSRSMPRKSAALFLGESTLGLNVSILTGVPGVGLEGRGDRKAYSPALENFSKKSLSLIGSPDAQTTDDSR